MASVAAASQVAGSVVIALALRKKGRKKRALDCGDGGL